MWYGLVVWIGSMSLGILPEKMKEHQVGTRHTSLRQLTAVGGVCCMDIGFVTNNCRGRECAERRVSNKSLFTYSDSSGIKEMKRKVEN